MRPRLSLVACLAVASLLLLIVGGADSAFPRPPWRKHPLMARWLASSASYGVLATLDGTGAPVGGVVSVADSPGNAAGGGGRLYAYLSPMDETTKNLAADPRVSLTLTEASNSPAGCGTTDPEDPTCARAAFLGEARRLPDGDEAEAAKACLFDKHPAMRGWPDDHSFAAYEVVVREVHLLDYYGGMAVIAGADYYAETTPPPGDDGGAPAQEPPALAAT